MLIAITTCTALTVVPTAQAQASHWCRQGDPPILAASSVSCAFAANIIDIYGNSRYCATHRVCDEQASSPVTKHVYAVTCAVHGSHLSGTVLCRAAGQDDPWVRFSTDV